MLHAALLRFHNRIAKLLDARREDFRIVQRLVRWH
jgi:hypothetical protein